MFRSFLCSLAALVASFQTVTAAVPTTGVPAYDAAATKAVAFLKQEIGKADKEAGHGSFMAYALLKGGEPASLPGIQKAIADVRSRISTTGYKPSNPSHHIYEAGVDILLLATADPEVYYSDIEAIAAYIIAQQGSDGSWDYPSRTVGDTSMAQYAALGLWSASQAGVNVPVEVWDKMAAWHIRTQHGNGGFQYHPGENVSPATGGAEATLNMTAGGTGTLAIALMHLHPGAMQLQQNKQKDEVKKKPFGVLEAKVSPEAAAAAQQNYKPTVSSQAILSSISKGLGWVAARYQPINESQPFRIYYDYALERTCALNNVPKLGNVDWYRNAGDALVKDQKPDGSWDDRSGKDIGAAFALLFFIRPTQRAVAAQYGEGILAGGRGIPTDLSTVDISGGKVKENKPSGPLDELLGDLTKLNPDDFGDVQAAIVEKIQLGDRSELLGEIDRIRKLITHPDAGIRQTAVWALGRSGDLKDANLLINALQDNNVDVLVEAYNALSYLSRKISGVGMPSNPLESLPPNASQTEKDAAVNSWRLEATKRWSAWYLRIRPYADRNDLFQLKFGTKVEKK